MFYQRYFKNIFRDGADERPSSFEGLTEEQLEAHMRVSRYGSFELTNAIRPSFDLKIIPSEGYRHDAYRNKDTGVDIPILLASATRKKLLDVFYDLLDPLGNEVDVVLMISHDRTSRGHDNLYREHIDLPVLKSTFGDFEELLLDDGCMGVAVMNPRVPLEVQFDDHKLLIVYGQDLSELEEILRQHCIPLREEMRFIMEGEHVHNSSEAKSDRCMEICYRLGMDETRGDETREKNEWAT